MEPHRRVAVIGAGIAGLAAAYYLQKYGFDVRVFERREQAGGMIRSSWREDKYLLEHGPGNYLSSSEHIVRLSRELSLDRLEVHHFSSRRFVFWDGAMHPLPERPWGMFSTKLMSPMGKLRLMAEPLVRSTSPDGETLAQFITRRAGSEALQSLVDPVVGCTWAGNPEELELKSAAPLLHHLEQNYGSVLRGIAKKRNVLHRQDVVSYRWGMGTLPARLEEVLKNKIKLGVEVERIARDENGRLFVVSGDPPRRLECDAVVIATAPQAAAYLVEPMLPRTATCLRAIPFCPLAVVHMAFKRSDTKLDRRGASIMIPRTAHVRMLGITVSSSLFEHRAPSDEVLLTMHVGGAMDRDALSLSDDELITEVRKGLHLVAHISAKPTYTRITRHERAIPQYVVGHADNRETITEELSTCPGLYLTGNYLSGITVSDTIGHARGIADAARTQLNRPRVTVIQRS